MINVFIYTFLPIIIIISVFGVLIFKFFKAKNVKLNRIAKLIFIGISIFLLYSSYSSFLIKKEGYFMLTSLEFDDILDIRVQKLSKHDLNNPILDKKLNKKEIEEFTQLINPIFGYWSEKYNKDLWKFWINLKGGKKIFLMIDDNNNQAIIEPYYMNKQIGFFKSNNIKVFLNNLN
jgi:hypothetical protein